MNPAQERLTAFLQQEADTNPAGIALAFSGGTDSALLLHLLADICKEKKVSLLALTAQSVLMSAGESMEAETLAREAGVAWHAVDLDPLSIPEVRRNDVRRCYFCKHMIFQAFRDFADSRGIQTVMDGTNADDRKEYRPGLQALRELRILSPLAECGLTKKEIRSFASDLGLQIAAKPAVPCMATRFEYGTELTPEALKRAASGERILRELLQPTAPLRLRVHHETLVRLEVPPALFPVVQERRDAIISALKRLGYAYVTLDLEGFRSGSMDRELQYQ